jgi:integrase/recombinase XerC
MPQGRQAKILNPRQETAILRYLETTRYPERNRVIFLLSLKAGMRAREIAAVTWAMVTDGEGQVGDAIALENRASKGQSGRLIPLHPLLRAALLELHQRRGDLVRPERAVVYSERGLAMSAATVRLWFHRLYNTLNMTGCSSHSGRRTFITRAARKVSEVGGSIRDVQQLAGHASMQTTQRYIDGDADAKRKLVYLL